MFADILISLLKQLLQQAGSNGTISEVLKAKYKFWCDQKILPNKASTDEYLDFFKAQVTAFKMVYLVIDAFDNIQNSSCKKTQDKLQEAIKELPSKVKILLTSRNSWHGRWDFKSCQELTVEPRDDDIEKYVKYRIEKNRAMQKKVKEASYPNFQYTITSKIMKATGGM